MSPADGSFARAPGWRTLTGTVIAALALLAGCGKQAPAPEKAPPNVTVLTVARKDVPITAVYVAQTQSSQAVNVQARVSGWLDKRMYVEGSVVKAGQVLFQMDPKPFQAQVDAAAGGTAAQVRRRCRSRRPNLDRTKPLAQQNALSQKDLDDATGQYEQSAAAVEQAQGAARDSAAQPLLHDDPLAGRWRVELRGRRRRHLPQSAECAADDGVRADADVDQLQRLRKRDGAHPQRRPQRPAQAARGRQVRRRGRNGRRQSLSVHRHDHVCRSVVQLDDGHVPAARHGEQSRRRAAPEPVRPRAPDRRHPAQRHRHSAARGPAKRQGPLRLGRSTRTTRPNCVRSPSATGRATAGSSPKA